MYLSTYTNISGHGDSEDIASHEDDRLLKTLQELQQCLFVAWLLMNPIGLEQGIGTLDTIIG